MREPRPHQMPADVLRSVEGLAQGNGAVDSGQLRPVADQAHWLIYLEKGKEGRDPKQGETPPQLTTGWW